MEQLETFANWFCMIMALAVVAIAIWDNLTD
jgi:hypothetical protein